MISPEISVCPTLRWRRIIYQEQRLLSADKLSTVLPLFEGETNFKSTGASTNVVVDFLYIRTVLPWEWRHNKLGIRGIGGGRRFGVLSHHFTQLQIMGGY